MPPRPAYLADPRLTALRPTLEEHLRQMGASLRPEQFRAVCPPLAAQLLQEAFARTGASEGSVWLLEEDGTALVNAFNTGARAAEIEQTLRLPFAEGLLGMVLASEQGFLENEVYRHRQHSKLVDERLGQLTLAMIAVPFYLLQQCRGVVSCVHLGVPGQPAGSGAQFAHEHLAVIQRAAMAAGDLLDYHLLRTALGWPAR